MYENAGEWDGMGWAGAWVWVGQRKLKEIEAAGDVPFVPSV